MFNFQDALYGLRNVAVGDDEQTRITDYTFPDDFMSMDEDYRNRLQSYLDQGEDDQAYRVTFEWVFKNEAPEDILRRCFVWAVEFVTDCYGLEDNESFVALAAALAIEMWNVYRETFHIKLFQEVGE